MHVNQDVILQTLFFLVHNNGSLNDLQGDNLQQEGKTSKYVTTPEPQEVCYNKFGCFDTRPPWSSPIRVFHYVPEPPHKIKPKYCLRTRLNREQCQHLDVNDPHTLFTSYIVPRHKTFFIIHGYIENYNRLWMQRICSELLRIYDVNVVIVDWSAGALPPYIQATANTRLVGVMTAHLIGAMVRKLGMRAEDMHVIGHSLGAHTAGYVGHTLQAQFGLKLGRITGLDPAEPYFTDSDPLVRLDPSDAHFVDAIHTDTAPFVSGGIGMRQPVGHADFYPNGGRDQPGCGHGVADFITEKDSMIFGLEKYLNCNHVRSNDFFIDSFLDECPFWAVQCESWELFKNGSCFTCSEHADNRVSVSSGTNVGAFYKGPRCARMGFHTPESIDKEAVRSGKPMKFFLMTDSQSPFCRNHYRVTVHVSNSSKSLMHGGEVGRMSVNIRGTGGETTEIKINERERFFEPGTVYKRVVGGPRVGLMTSAMLRWEYETSMNPLTWRLLSSPRVFVAKVTVDSIEGGDRMTIVPPMDMPLISRKPLQCSRVEREDTASRCQVLPLKPL